MPQFFLLRQLNNASSSASSSAVANGCEFFGDSVTDSAIPSMSNDATTLTVVVDASGTNKQ